MTNVIAIGALGGSGTRAVAQVLIDAGVYMGDDLNAAHDNLVFTRLFKDPEWYKTAGRDKISKRLFVFEEYMKKDRLSPNSLNELFKACMQNHTFSSNIKFYIRALLKLLAKSKNRNTWGWKEPNTQIYIEEIADYFPNLKYIHILRNGLDMAFSNNKQQLKNWGNRYGIILKGAETNEELAVMQLDYWIESTKEATNKGKSLGNNFLMINHTEFCSKPKPYIDQIIQFIELSVPEPTLNKLYKIPKATESNERYKHFDLKIFDETQLSFVRKMGFDI